MPEAADILADDVSHPIPQVDICDIHAVREGGGADLVIVIATPIKNDYRSRQRLMKKVENYLGYITSKAFAKEHGSPSRENTSIKVQIHPDSENEILVLLEQCRGWIEDNHARLEIKILANQPPLPMPAPGVLSKPSEGTGMAGR